jgi:hypothetical protein
MKYIKTYENNWKPDLREMSEYVKCIKDFRIYKGFEFKKGEIYRVVKMFGDPQNAIEEYGINDYLPVQCIHKIWIETTSRKNIYQFNFNVTNEDFPNFFDYFEIIEEMTAAKKYNL